MKNYNARFQVCALMWTRNSFDGLLSMLLVIGYLCCGTAYPSCLEAPRSKATKVTAERGEIFSGYNLQTFRK
jgi:hypothetical protein